MIIEVRAKNVFSFTEQIVLSMKADMRSKKFAANVHQENNFNVLKTIGIYGPNNAGKTCLVKCIRVIKEVLLNRDETPTTNLFTENSISEMGITFLHDGKKYSYDFRYCEDKKSYTYEKFSQIFKDQYGNEKEEVWLLRDSGQNQVYCIDVEVMPLLHFVTQNNILIHLIDTAKFKKLKEMKRVLVEFASKIDVINMNNIPMKKTIELMKNRNDLQRKIVSFIKNADLYLENYEYVPDAEIRFKEDEDQLRYEEKVLEIPDQIMDQIRLVSTYKGIRVPSMLFDSTGTKKIAALASYIIESFEQGRILVVDELDNGIHFKLTRAIVAMFNNELNNDAQLIFTVHDINLMDCKRLLRKEQIWFIHKDEHGVYVYSLADFTAQEGVRDTTDIIEKYRKGALGALPDPELIYSLLELKGNNREGNMNEQ